MAGELARLGLHPVAAAAGVSLCGPQISALLNDQPLEVILEGLTEGLPEGRDEVAWYIYTQGLDFTSANANHTIIAHLVLRGASVVTTNQDPLLEVALSALSGDPAKSWALFDERGVRDTSEGDPDSRVLHLHGVVHLPDVGDERLRPNLAALLWNTSMRLVDWRYERFRARVRNRKVVIIGYGGSDFDLLASLVDLQDEYDSAVWTHLEGECPKEKVLALRDLLGTKCTIEPLTRQLMHRVGIDGWDTSLPTNGRVATPLPWVDALGLSRVEAATALATLCNHVDMFADAVEILQNADVDSSSDGLPHLRMAQALKGLFRHKEALVHIDQAQRAFTAHGQSALLAEAENLRGQIICAFENMSWLDLVPYLCEMRLRLLRKSLQRYRDLLAKQGALKPSFRSDEAAMYHNVGSILWRFGEYHAAFPLRGPYVKRLRAMASRSLVTAARLYLERGDIRQLKALRTDAEGGDLGASVRPPSTVPASFTDLWAN
jgi:hypothetical protein